MKNAIFHLLKHADRPVSGEFMSQKLGVSRVTIHKYVNGLRDLGYAIAASSAGYSLEKDQDFLFPWEFEGRESSVHFFDEIVSTMDEARRLAEEGCPSLTVVAAQRQTAGRGRLRRLWHSMDGGLYFTVVLRPDLPVLRVHRVLFAASTALVHTLRGVCGIDASVKWPNDILVGNRKLSGMLSEMSAEGELVQYVNLGIGLNVNNDPAAVEPRAVSVKDLLGRDFPRKVILGDFLNRLEASLPRLEEEDVIARWKECASTLNRPVRIETTKTVLEGQAVDVDAQGSLIVELPGGAREVVSHGDCFYTN